MTGGALRRVAAPLCRARHRHLPGARQDAGDQQLPAAAASGQPQPRQAVRRCARLRVCPEAGGDRRRRRGHARRSACSPTRWPCMATRRSSCARAAATSRPGTGGPMRAGTSVPIRACRSTSSATASSWRRPRSGRRGRTRSSRARSPTSPPAGLQNPPATAADSRHEVGRVGRANATGRSGGIACAQARYCDDFDALLDVARTANADFLPPLADAEVVKARPVGVGLHRARPELVRARQAGRHHLRRD